MAKELLTPELVAAAVAAGRVDFDGPDASAALETFRALDGINRLHWREWDGVTAPMPTEDVVALLKALVCAEARFGWAGGSVAAAIWVYQTLESRDPARAHEVADWILPRRQNPYVPFGSAYQGPPTYDGYLKAQAARAARSAVHTDAENKQQEQAATRRKAHVDGAALRAAAGQAAAEVRREAMGSFARLSPAEQLEHIAADGAHEPDYYPFSPDWEDDAVLNVLSNLAKEALVSRLGSRRKGPWRNLVNKLQAGAAA